jgi:hypothetical protein
MMRKLVFIALVCGFVAAPALADIYGGRVLYNRVGGYFSGNGGEFTLSSDGGPGLLLDLSAYINGVTKNVLGSSDFQTFCVETSEYVFQPMDIVVSTTFINESTGAVSGPGSHAILGSKPYGDNLDARTAYLYTKFVQGTLAGYNYTAGAGRVASAGALQAAIWWIEGEAGGVNNSFFTLANTAVALGGEWYGMGIGDVRILNTWKPGYVGDLAYKKQDQLYLTPVPGAVLLGILGLGLAGWKLRRFA